MKPAIRIVGAAMAEPQAKRKRQAPRHADMDDGLVAPLEKKVVKPKKSEPAIVRLTVTQPLAALTPEEESLLRKYNLLREVRTSRVAEPSSSMEEAEFEDETSRRAALAAALAAAQHGSGEEQERILAPPSKRGPSKRPRGAPI